MFLPTHDVNRNDLILFGAMILGILAKEVWDNINKTGQIEIALPRIVAAILISPVIYLGVSHYFNEHKRITFVTLAIAFQSGFFWQSIFAPLQIENV